MCARVFGETSDMDSHEHVTIIDRNSNEKRAEIQRNITLKRAERVVAQNPGFIFIGGKGTRDLYHDMLARRVIRRFKENARNRLREKVAYVIAAVTGVNANTAHGIVGFTI
jgi:putative intracellular protease/amidase